jgi:hypothetical protein
MITIILKVKDEKRYKINKIYKYCDEWGYGNKDTCKYIADMLTEDLTIDNNFKYEKAIKYWNQFISLAHDMNSGGKFYNIESEE